MNRASGMVRMGIVLRRLRRNAWSFNPMHGRKLGRNRGKENGMEKPGAGFGVGGDWEYAGGAFEEDRRAGDGGGAGEAGVLQPDRIVQGSDGAGDD